MATPLEKISKLSNATTIYESVEGPAEEKSNASIEDKDEAYRRELSVLFRNLRSYAASGRTYYQDSPDLNSQRFYRAYTALHDHVDRGIEPGTEYLLNVAHLYDLDSSVPGNGYRSFVTVIHRCAKRLFVLTRHIACFRDSYLFRGEHYGKELEAFVTALGQLRACLYYLLKLVAYCPEGRLFPDEELMSKEDYHIAEQLLVEVEGLCQESFYGRCLGFQV